jgi:hypothetical protein
MKATTVGGVIKRLLEINPDLTAGQIFEIIRECTRVRNGDDKEFAWVEVTDQDKAIELARQIPKLPTKSAAK